VHGNNIQIFGHDYDRGEGKELAKQVEEIYLTNLKSPLIFAGDLNCDDVNSIYPELINHLSLRNTLPVGSTRADKRRTDYILCSPEIEVVDSAIVKTKSDHYLCWAKVRLTS
jgi:endonuclease/exonuclease/phosphatase family metal-dependent hydrolase